jgi:hypothetical protein
MESQEQHRAPSHQQQTSGQNNYSSEQVKKKYSGIYNTVNIKNGFD